MKTKLVIVFAAILFMCSRATSQENYDSFGEFQEWIDKIEKQYAPDIIQNTISFFTKSGETRLYYWEPGNIELQNVYLLSGSLLCGNSPDYECTEGAFEYRYCENSDWNLDVFHGQTHIGSQNGMSCPKIIGKACRKKMC